MNTIWRTAGRATATIFAALLLAAAGGVGCGGSLVDNRPSDADGGPSIRLTASTKTQTSTTAPVVRANGRDSLLLEAEVSGLSQMVGFYIPTTYGVVSTTAATVVDVDGYAYFPTDRSGVSRATVVAGIAAGKSEVIAKSKQLTASLPVTFEFATLTLAPATMNLSSDGARGTITALGALPPVHFSASDPAAIRLTKTSDTTVQAFVADLGALVALGVTGVTVTGVDAEGQTASTVITATLTCANAVVTVSPATSAAGITTATISVLVTDTDRSGQSSVPVIVNYPTAAGAPPTTLTLTPWVTPGTFQANYTVACPACTTGDIVRFDYSDLASDCLTPKVVSASFTMG